MPRISRRPYQVFDKVHGVKLLGATMRAMPVAMRGRVSFLQPVQIFRGLDKPDIQREVAALAKRHTGTERFFVRGNMAGHVGETRRSDWYHGMPRGHFVPGTNRWVWNVETKKLSGIRPDEVEWLIYKTRHHEKIAADGRIRFQQAANGKLLVEFYFYQSSRGFFHHTVEVPFNTVNAAGQHLPTCRLVSELDAKARLQQGVVDEAALTAVAKAFLARHTKLLKQIPSNHGVELRFITWNGETKPEFFSAHAYIEGKGIGAL